jgi:hypothetical protein
VTSPTLHKLSNGLERFSVESLCEVIRPLFFRVDLQDCNVAIASVAPEEMPLYQEILSAIGDSPFGSKKEGAVVVLLKDAAANGGLELDGKAKH